MLKIIHNWLVLVKLCQKIVGFGFFEARCSINLLLQYCSSIAGADPGGADPLFWQNQFYFLHCIQCLKKICLKLNLDFIVAEIRGVFGSVWGVCVCVWIEIVAATVFCSAKAPFWMICEAILIPKIYGRLQEIASNFSKFSGEAPRPRSRLRRSVRGFAPLPGPLSKIPGSAPALYFKH